MEQDNLGCGSGVLIKKFLEATGLVVKVEREIKDFFIWNKGSAPSTSIWDAFKVYIHRVLIAFKAFRDKKRGSIKKKVKGCYTAISKGK